MAQNKNKNEQIDVFSSENEQNQAISQEKQAILDTPTPKTEDFVENEPKSPIVQDKSIEIVEKYPLLKKNQDFFLELSDFLNDFIKSKDILQKSDANQENESQIQPQSKEYQPISSNNRASTLKEFNDYEDFVKKYPESSLKILEDDISLQLFLSGRVKTDSLTDLYQNYKKLKDLIEKDALERLLAKEALEKSSVGALSTPEKSNDGFFTKEQVLQMSKEQISRNFDKIRQSQQRW